MVGRDKMLYPTKGVVRGSRLVMFSDYTLKPERL